jgi:hypothetical protein|tara:strand:- start:752 stop:1282 length:531 start_codon:yes stop_codon:yes gene_type:complete
MEVLKTKIYNLYDLSNSYSLEEYNLLIKECVSLYEMAAVVFLYDNMKFHHINPTNETYNIINILHSKTCPDNNKIVIKDQTIKKLKPRRRIHKIMKGHNYSDNYKTALKYTELVKSYIMLHPEIRKFNRIKMAKVISSNCDVEFDKVRYIITNLKKTKFLTDKNMVHQKSITDFFN